MEECIMLQKGRITAADSTFLPGKIQNEKKNKRMILTIFTIIIKEDIVCVHMQKKVSMFIKD